MSTPLPALENAERDARLRLQRYRAKVYTRPVDPMTSQIRLAELERRWRLALEDLRRAKAGIV